jgi:hypothetical protein
VRSPLTDEAAIYLAASDCTAETILSVAIPSRLTKNKESLITKILGLAPGAWSSSIEVQSGRYVWRATPRARAKSQRRLERTQAHVPVIDRLMRVDPAKRRLIHQFMERWPRMRALILDHYRTTG